MRALIQWGGAAVLIALIALAVTEAPLGTPLFFSIAAVPCIVYGLLLRHLLAASGDAEASAYGSRLFTTAVLLAISFRVPLVLEPVNPDNDMIRYVYDGRLQRLGINPFTVVPSDPALRWTHTDVTRRNQSMRSRTPYPAAAQLFFRAVVTISESGRVMKLALVICDLLTIWILIAWMRGTHRTPWLAMCYAWNPLVILEVAHSGHIDGLGALWIAITAWMLGTGRTMRAAIAFVVAVATKLLPIVLLPLFWKRIRIRDAVAAAAVFFVLYLPFRSAGTLPLGNVPNVVEFIRFNGPLFKWLAETLTPRAAAMIAVLGGLAVAGRMRVTRDVNDPAAWAWPMAVSLAAAPVIYPWYLLYFTPFLFSRDTVPLLAWTFTALPVYSVWYLSKLGYRWRVRTSILWVEFAAPLLMLIATSSARWRRR